MSLRKLSKVKTHLSVDIEYFEFLPVRFDCSESESSHLCMD